MIALGFSFMFRGGKIAMVSDQSRTDAAKRPYLASVVIKFVFVYYAQPSIVSASITQPRRGE